MDALVGKEAGTASEASHKPRALLSSVSSVDVPVGVEASKAFPALRVLARSLSCAGVLLTSEAGTAFEALPTLRALVGSFSPVWMRWWRMRWELLLKFFEHSGHLKALSPVWMSWW